MKGNPVQASPPPTRRCRNLHSTGILMCAQALCPEAVACDPRVMNRVQTHLVEGTAGFHLNLVDSLGNLLPRKLAVTPLQITVLSPPTAGQPGSSISTAQTPALHMTRQPGASTSYPLTQQTTLALVPGDNQVALRALHAVIFSCYSSMSQTPFSAIAPHRQTWNGTGHLLPPPALATHALSSPLTRRCSRYLAKIT